MKKIEIKKILVPVDFTTTSEMAINEAVALAALLKAEVYLIHVIESYSSVFSGVLYGQPVLEITPDFEKDVQSRLDKMKESIKKKSNVAAKVFVANGQVYSEVINFSAKQGVDLIIMGTHGASGYKEVFIGSNAQRVVTLSDIPVLTIQEKKNKAGFKNILLPIDDSLHSREKINMAMVIAGLFKAKIHIIGLPASKSKVELNKFSIKLQSVEKIIATGKLSYTTTLVHGSNLAKAAMKYAVDNKCDLIVINTGHESKLSGIFLGAFAQQIVNHSKIPVLNFKHTKDHSYIDAPGFGIS